MPDQLPTWLCGNNYQNIRQLEDGSWAATSRLIFTTSILLGLNYDGYEMRYCFENEREAVKQLLLLKSADDIPHGWIDVRGVGSNKAWASRHQAPGAQKESVT